MNLKSFFKRTVLHYSIENIYYNYGQFDKGVTITFGNGTNANKLFGDEFTGFFVYSNKERIILSKKIIIKPLSSTNGIVRFREIMKTIPDDKREALYKKGIRASDILNIRQSSNGNINYFKNSKKIY